MAYKIKSGDTLSQIAKDNNTTVQAIMDLNPSITNPHEIFAGNTINLPSSGSSSSVPSSAGSTLLKSPIAGVSDQMYTDYHNMSFTESADTTANKNKRDETAAKIENLPNSEWNSKVNRILTEIEQMKPFSYDFSTDPMFQNMLGSYQAMGQNAMKDTVAQSSALTGGYGNSWAQTAGQQTYNQYLQDAFNNLPEYYQLALSAYESERDALLDKYGLYSSERQNESDELKALFDLYSGLYDSGYTKDYNTYKDLLGKLSTEMEWLNSEDWKKKEYNATQSARATELAMQEAKMKANGYVKNPDGTWSYDATKAEEQQKKEEKAATDARIAAGVETAYERGGVEEAIQFLENYGGLEDDDMKLYLSVIGATASSTNSSTKKALTKQQALSALASDLLGKRAEFEKANEAYDLSGLADFYDPSEGTEGYEVEEKGGWNGVFNIGTLLGNINDNASIKTPYGVITMKEYYDALVANGVPASTAKAYVANLQNTFNVY